MDSISSTGRALLIVDVQPTFCENGELAVNGGNAIAVKIADYVASHRRDYALLVTSQDWHIDPGAHFAAEPDYVDTWPPHGLVGTPGADLHPALADALGPAGPDIAIRKGQHAAAYSAFDGVDQGGRPLAAALTSTGIAAVDVCGIAESHCVRATGLDARALGLGVRLLTDLTVPVTAEAGAAARRDLLAAGATLAATE